MAAILTGLHMRTVHDLFGGPRGKPAHRPIDRGEHSVG
jgi:hypothetical protein